MVDSWKVVTFLSAEWLLHLASLISAAYKTASTDENDSASHSSSGDELDLVTQGRVPLFPAMLCPCIQVLVIPACWFPKCCLRHSYVLRSRSRARTDVRAVVWSWGFVYSIVSSGLPPASVQPAYCAQHREGSHPEGTEVVLNSARHKTGLVGSLYLIQRQAVPGCPVETGIWLTSSKPFCLLCLSWKTDITYDNIFSRNIS